MSRIENIIAFVNVVEQNSFAKAAKLLNLSAPTISRQISELESELGVALLHRSTKNLVLTSFGSEYLAKAEALLTQYEEMCQLAFMNKNEPAGKLKIQAPKYSLETYILHLSPHFFMLESRIRA